MQVKKQQLELDMEQWTGSKLGKENVKAVYCHPAYLNYMQSTSCEILGWIKHKEIKIADRNINNHRYSNDTIFMSENKEEILKVSREKQHITHKGIPIRITADLSTETLQARREWQDIFKVIKEENLQPRLLYSARITFKNEGEIKSYTDKQKLREFRTTKPPL